MRDVLAFDTDEETGLPYGWSAWGNDEILSGHPGTDSYRDPHAVECENDILWLFAHGEQHQMTCNYCGASTRSRSRSAATRWFHSHDCESCETDDLRLDDALDGASIVDEFADDLRQLAA